MKAEVTKDDNGIHFEIKDDGSAEYQKAWNIVKDANAKEEEFRKAMGGMTLDAPKEIQMAERVSKEVASWSQDNYDFVSQFLPPVDCLVDALHDPVAPTSGERIRGKAIGGKQKP